MISKTSMMVSLTFRMVIFPCLLIVFWAASSTRSPADEMYSRPEKSSSSSVMPESEVLSSASSCGAVLVSRRPSRAMRSVPFSAVL